MHTCMPMSAGWHPFVKAAEGGGSREGEGGAPPGGVRSGEPRRAAYMYADMSAG